MLTEIVEAIHDTLQLAGVDTQQISYQEIIDRKVGALQRPAVNISINSCKFSPITFNTYKAELVVTLTVMVQNLIGESKARTVIYDLIHSIIESLYQVSMNLELQDSMLPIGFTNVTDSNYAGAGYQLYQIDFSCAYNYTLEEEFDEGMLARIVNTYQLIGQDPQTPRTVELGSIWGGSAWVEPNPNLRVFGGTASNNYFNIQKIYGGAANSTYN